jgi:Carboxypeptidase regulatory-like domain
LGQGPTTQAITQVNGPIIRILVDAGTPSKKSEPPLYVSNPRWGQCCRGVPQGQQPRAVQFQTKRIVDRMKEMLDHRVAAVKHYISSVADYDAATYVHNSPQLKLRIERVPKMNMMPKTIAAIALAASLSVCNCFGQSLGNAGTIQGTVSDPSGGSVARAVVTLANPVSGYKQSVVTAADGSFRLVNIPPNPYRLEVTASGFDVFSQDVSIKNAIPIQEKAVLAVAGGKTTVTIEAAGADILENDPSAHVDVDRSMLMKLPAFDPGGGLSEAIVYSTGGVAADANGFFHPLGDHAQVSFVIDGQPISDQQSKLFSTQLPTSAIQSMEATTGTPNAEFGDKSSLVAQITTRSGLGAGKVFGNIDATYGSFGTAGSHPRPAILSI